MPSEHRDPEHRDVVVVGAGISGIAAGHYLSEYFPDKSYTILEARDAIGGTWDLFRYPGVRSDSDMLTLGYAFRPWRGREVIADGASIREYVRETAREEGIEDHIRFGHTVLRAEWSSEDALWTLDVSDGAGTTSRMTCWFLFGATGYYRYGSGYTPDFPGTERFAGRIVHPQQWPEDLDYTGKRVVVVGSGATAVTLIPAMAEHAERVTMLQRSPSYIASLPAVDPLVEALRRALPTKAAYLASRWLKVATLNGSFSLSRAFPRLMGSLLRKGVARQLPEGYDVDRHFRPTYNPWDQRLCVVPDGDLFRAIRAGRADVVTDSIDTFTERGVRLASGDELEADVVVTATGLSLLPLGGIDLVVDGEPVSPPDTMAYRGMMLSGVPNFAFAFGYTNASWTLKVDLTCEYLCKLWRHMDSRGYSSVTPQRQPEVGEQPFVDLTSGYVLRAMDKFPKQGDREPWRVHMNYPRDILALRYGSVDDGLLRFDAAPAEGAADAGEPARAAAG